MIEGALTKAAFEKEKEQHKGDAIITYWCASDFARILRLHLTCTGPPSVTMQPVSACAGDGGPPAVAVLQPMQLC